MERKYTTIFETRSYSFNPSTQEYELYVTPAWNYNTNDKETPKVLHVSDPDMLEQFLQGLEHETCNQERTWIGVIEGGEWQATAPYSVFKRYMAGEYSLKFTKGLRRKGKEQ